MTAIQQARAAAPAANAMPAPTYRLYARDPTAKTSTYVKADPSTQIRTYLIFDADGTVRVRKTQRVDATLDINKAQANGFSGYRDKDWVCTSRVPLVEWTKLLAACGAAPGRSPEYDRDRMRKILNDADYRAFKTVPGRV